MGMKPRKFSKTRTAIVKGWLPKSENTIEKILAATSLGENAPEGKSEIKTLASFFVYDTATWARGHDEQGDIRKVKVSVTIAVEEID
jgi:hypothetical protein